MKLRELVSELRANILRDTSDVVRADQNNYLLDDASLVRYINDAEQRFASRTLCLRDETTPAICQIVPVAGQDTYALDPRIVAIYGATVHTVHIARGTYAALTTGRGTSMGNYADTRESSGRPRLFYTDRETQRIGFYPAPATEWIAALTVRSSDVLAVPVVTPITLRVARMPLFDLTPDRMDAVPEIPMQYHMDLLEWAAWRALRNHDNDLENLQKASAHKKAFEDTVLELETRAKRLLMQDIQFAVPPAWSNC